LFSIVVLTGVHMLKPAEVTLGMPGTFPTVTVIFI
jgi:hypothetical protein